MHDDDGLLSGIFGGETTLNNLKAIEEAAKTNDSLKSALQQLYALLGVQVQAFENLVLL